MSVKLSKFQYGPSLHKLHHISTFLHNKRDVYSQNGTKATYFFTLKVSITNNINTARLKVKKELSSSRGKLPLKFSVNVFEHSISKSGHYINVQNQ